LLKCPPNLLAGWLRSPTLAGPWLCQVDHSTRPSVSSPDPALSGQQHRASPKGENWVNCMEQVCANGASLLTGATTFKEKLNGRGGCNTVMLCQHQHIPGLHALHHDQHCGMSAARVLAQTPKSSPAHPVFSKTLLPPLVVLCEMPQICVCSLAGATRPACAVAKASAQSAAALSTWPLLNLKSRGHAGESPQSFFQRAIITIKLCRRIITTTKQLVEIG